MINSGKIPSKPDTPNLIEVMACEGGCIGGPSIIKNVREAEVQLQKYVETGAADTIRQGERENRIN